MTGLNFLAVVTATVVVFVVSAIYYILVNRQLAALSPAYADASQPVVGKIALEPIRTILTAVVVAWLSDVLDIADVASAFRLAFFLWIGFPVVLLAGSVIHENVPWRLAAIHAGDWLLKLGIIGAIVGLWR